MTASEREGRCAPYRGSCAPYRPLRALLARLRTLLPPCAIILAHGPPDAQGKKRKLGDWGWTQALAVCTLVHVHRHPPSGRDFGYPKCKR
jgi:hypothetical protein